MTLNDAGESDRPFADVKPVDWGTKENVIRFSKVDREMDEWSTKMALALNGDKIAYSRLLEEIARFAPIIARKIFLRTNYGAASVDDVVQDILFAVHLKRDVWDRRRKLKPWVAAIAFHKCIDELRRIRTRRTFELDYSIVAIVDPFLDMQSGLFIAHLVDQLAPRQRDIVVSISLKGHSVSATAERLSMSEVAVRVALHRSLKKMAALAES